MSNMQDLRSQSDGPSEIWLRKMKTLFRYLDANHNGTLEKNDCYLMVERFKKYGNMTEEQVKRFKEKMGVWWEDTFKDIDHDTILYDEYLKARYQITKFRSSQEALEHAKGNIGMMFQAIDSDNDGIISFPEWRAFHLAIGIEDKAATAKSFETVDLDQDGKLSSDEFIKGSFDFLYNEEDSVYKEFLGPMDPL